MILIYTPISDMIIIYCVSSAHKSPANERAGGETNTHTHIEIMRRSLILVNTMARRLANSNHALPAAHINKILNNKVREAEKQRVVCLGHFRREGATNISICIMKSSCLLLLLSCSFSFSLAYLGIKLLAFVKGAHCAPVCP